MNPMPSPGLPEFEYIKPKNLDEASRFLAEHAGEARPLSGGTDILVRLRERQSQVRYLVDVKALEAMQTVRLDAAGGLLVLGAGVTLNQICQDPVIREHYPLLAEAARSVGGYQIRSRATLVGNLCAASPAADTSGACIVLGGRLRIYGPNGVKTTALTDFFTGPGTTALAPGEIVTAIELPAPKPGSAGRYLKLGRNRMGDLPIVGVTVYAYPDPAVSSGFSFRIALASVGPGPFVPLRAETLLADRPINDQTIEEAADLVAVDCSPADDLRASAWYRRAMARNLTRRALQAVWEQLHARHPIEKSSEE